jgi:hypothetical protein
MVEQGKNRFRSGLTHPRLLAVEDGDWHGDPVGVGRAAVVAPEPAETIAAIHRHRTHANAGAAGIKAVPSPRTVAALASGSIEVKTRLASPSATVQAVEPSCRATSSTTPSASGSESSNPPNSFGV